MSRATINTMADIIDLDRYPIDRPTLGAGKRLVEECRRALESKALCRLPGFIREERLASFAEEAGDLIPYAHYRREDMLFDTYEPRSKGDAQPPSVIIENRYRQILNGDIGPQALIRQLYDWTALTEFVRLVFGAKTMYRSHCPHLCLTYKIEDEGDTDGWHYDGNDGVVSLLLQKPDAGGDFEYAPYIRSEQDQCYEQVEKVFADPHRFASRPTIEPGTFVFFKGNLSLHRVTPVGPTTRPRIIALLSYDQTHDQVFSPEYVEHLRSFPRQATR